MKLTLHALSGYLLPLPQDMVVEPAPRLSMRRPNALLLKDQHSSEPVYLAFESREERQQWMDTILQAILDLRVWGASACDHTIPVPSSKFYVESPSKDLYTLPSVTTPHKEPPTSTVRTHTVVSNLVPWLFSPPVFAIWKYRGGSPGRFGHMW